MSSMTECDRIAPFLPLAIPGLLEAHELAVVQAHIEAGCGRCQAELDAYEDVAYQLAMAGDSRTPSAELRGRLREHVRRQGVPRQADSIADGVFILRSQDQRWQPTEFPGVDYCVLFSNDPDRVTQLLRMQPGAEYPMHRHAHPEQCLVLEGTLRIGDSVLYQGDFELALAGTAHGPVRTDDGALALIVSSRRDELL